MSFSLVMLPPPPGLSQRPLCITAKLLNCPEMPEKAMIYPGGTAGKLLNSLYNTSSFSRSVLTSCTVTGTWAFVWHFRCRRLIPGRGSGCSGQCRVGWSSHMAGKVSSSFSLGFICMHNGPFLHSCTVLQFLSGAFFLATS